MFKFAHPQYLDILFILPVIIAIFILTVYLRKRALKKYGQMSVITQLMPDISFVRPIIKFIFIFLAFASIIIAIAGPQFGSKLKEVKQKGVEVIIALDVSNSMLAQDIQPNRLENAKRAINKLVNKMTHDKIGLIAFAGDAYTQVPITTDYTSTKMMVSSITPGMVSKQGTAIGSAIELAINSFGPEEERSRVIIIITDGENHEDDPISFAEQAKEKGIVVHTIGMGLPDGAPLPMPNGKDFRRDQNGSVVVSKLDEITLQKIAAAGEGIYVRANNYRTGLNMIFDEINSMQKQEIEAKIYSEYDEQFPYFIGFAFLMLFLEFILLERKNRILKDLNLFK